jgi:DinB superfamily
MKSKRPARKRKAPPSNDAILRQHLIDLLRGGHAHVTLEKAIAGLPASLRGARHPSLPFTAWGLLEHLRIAQWDILEFSRDAKHVSPQWPEGYWPAADGPASDKAWGASIKTLERDLGQMEKLVKNSATNLFRPIPHGTGQTILREAMLLADHNAYHVGQLVLLRRLLGTWKDD